MESQSNSTEQHLPRRPLIDINPDAPLKFYGFRISRDGGIYASTSPMVHGRSNKNYETRVGDVAPRNPRCRVWIGRTLSGMPFEAESQSGAAMQVYKFAERQQQGYNGWSNDER